MMQHAVVAFIENQKMLLHGGSQRVPYVACAAHTACFPAAHMYVTSFLKLPIELFSLAFQQFG